MRDVEFIEEVDDSVDAGSPTFLLFTRENSDERDRLIRAIDRLLRRNPSVRAFHIDLDTIPTAAGRFTIYSTPAFAVYYRGRMVNKVEGGFHTSHVARTLNALLG